MVHDFSLVFDTENPLWNNVLEIFKRNESYPKKCVKGRSLHHKFPRAISKYLNISKGKMGHSTSEETRKKIGEANSQKLKGRKITEEHRNNISKAKTGVKREPIKEGQKETLSKLWKGKHWRIVNGKREWY